MGAGSPAGTGGPGEGLLRAVPNAQFSRGEQVCGQTKDCLALRPGLPLIIVEQVIVLENKPHWAVLDGVIGEKSPQPHPGSAV